MVRSPLIYASAALFCAILFFSCTVNVEQAPPAQSSSSESEPEYSSSTITQSSNQGEQSSSATINQSSSQVVQSSSAIITQSSSQSEQQPPPPSSSSKAQPASGCGESNPIEGFTCGWNVTGVLTPGTILKPAEYNLPLGCSSVAWKYAPDTASMVLANGCLLTDENGFAALGSKNYVLFAELTCDDGKHTTACNPKTGLASKVAPVLEGHCEWSKNPTTTARGAVPSGVSIVDVDKICTSPTIAYKYDGGTKDWPKEGGPLAEAKTYTDVEAVLNCPAYPMTITSRCPDLEVKGGADYQIVCDGDQIGPNCKPAYGELKVGNDECIDLEINWTNQYYSPGLIMECSANFQMSGGSYPNTSLSIKVGNNPAVTRTGDLYVSTQATVIPKIQVGTIEVLGICVSYTSTQNLPANVNCSLRPN